MNYYYKYSSTSPALTNGVTKSPIQNLPSASGSLQPVSPYTATGLTSRTNYWFRLVAEAGGQTLYGPILSFYTGSSSLYTVFTNPPTNVNAPVLNSATLEGNYTFKQGSTGVWYFEYSLGPSFPLGVTQQAPSPGLPITASGTTQP